ncbi:hypothetical protein BAZG_02797 [Brucella sp. NVSL 07-0026]|nr:hypothetical protein BAZG_02797 [Brucella sp. NVSL 07-0026]
MLKKYALLKILQTVRQRYVISNMRHRPISPWKGLRATCFQSREEIRMFMKACVSHA